MPKKRGNRRTGGEVVFKYDVSPQLKAVTCSGDCGSKNGTVWTIRCPYAKVVLENRTDRDVPKRFACTLREAGVKVTKR